MQFLYVQHFEMECPARKGPSNDFLGRPFQQLRPYGYLTEDQD